MAYYLVRAKPIEDRLRELKQRLKTGEIRKMRPFGTSLDYSLKNARLAPDATCVWEEEDYCQPALAQERAAVLDHYFTHLTAEAVKESTGWRQIERLPSLWSAHDRGSAQSDDADSHQNSGTVGRYDNTASRKNS